MTKEEIKKRSQEKIKQINDLYKELEVVVTAEEMLDERGIIKKVVYYTDTENYPLDKEEKKND